ncbi:uncharacterized protein ATNIH1004_010640 [Aspergillus tanneri]|uniref:Uncharacterized protein n=1 Tax=Aspergillus tanneri TaxID=1220188 RepID=A0A5M9MA19_9EURO|nr:uncharacterized protein ATNIH1004_010640 [Aspergillus tanneri]KAA8643865.1 hypothetical protein ATNIH1004_010640 [Aspergillus tanneri]
MAPTRRHSEDTIPHHPTAVHWKTSVDIRLNSGLLPQYIPSEDSIEFPQSSPGPRPLFDCPYSS